MLNYDGRVLRPLQVAVDEWCNTTSRLIKNCDCKYLNHPHTSNSDVDLYFTEHTETVQLTELPVVLHVKVKDRFRQRPSIDISEKFLLNGMEYLLKSGMLYTGTGERGHWRCIVKQGEKLIVYNDEQIPVRGGAKDLKNGTDFIFVKNVLYQPPMAQNLSLTHEAEDTNNLDRGQESDTPSKRPRTQSPSPNPLVMM